MLSASSTTTSKSGTVFRGGEMMAGMGAAIAITWARFGVKIEKENETQDMFEIYISVPERSFHRNVNNEEMAGRTLAKRFKDVLTEMGVKRLVLKSRTRHGEVWTKELADEAELNMRRKLFGSQY